MARPTVQGGWGLGGRSRMPSHHMTATDGKERLIEDFENI